MTTSREPTSNTASTQYTSVANFLKLNRGTVGRTLLYEAIRRGEIPHIRIGRRILVPHNALDIMLEAPRRDHHE